MKVRTILYVIILGLVINLLTNLIWHYLPETHPYTYPIVTVVLVVICVLLVTFDKHSSVTNGNVTIENIQGDKVKGDKTVIHTFDNQSRKQPKEQGVSGQSKEDTANDYFQLEKISVVAYGYLLLRAGNRLIKTLGCMIAVGFAARLGALVFQLGGGYFFGKDGVLIFMCDSTLMIEFKL